LSYLPVVAVPKKGNEKSLQGKFEEGINFEGNTLRRGHLVLETVQAGAIFLGQN
jgi:hypothetical protein